MDIREILNDEVDDRRARRIPRPSSGKAATGAQDEMDSGTWPVGHLPPLPALYHRSSSSSNSNSNSSSSSSSSNSSSSGSVAPFRRRMLSPPPSSSTPTSAKYTTANTSALRTTTSSNTTASSPSASNTLLPFRQQKRSPPSTTSASPFPSSTSAPASSSYHLHPNHRPGPVATLRKNSSSSSSASSQRTMDSTFSTPFLSRSNSGDSAYHSPATPISPGPNEGLGFGSYGGGFDPGFQRPLITHQNSYMAHQQHIDPYGMLQGFQFPPTNGPDGYPDPVGEPCSPTKKDSPSSQDQSPSSKPKRKTSYPCPCAVEFQCPNVFTTSGHAARHAKVHTGEKNAVCPECKKAFTRKDNMEQHRKIHNGHKQPSRSEDRARKSKMQQARKARRPSSISTVSSVPSHDVGIDVSGSQAYYPHSASTDYSPMSFQHPQFSPVATGGTSYLDAQFDNSHINGDMSHFYGQMPISPAGSMQVHSLDALALAAESSR